MLHDPPEPIRSGPVASLLAERQRECSERDGAAASGAFALAGEGSRAAEAQVYGTAFAAKRSIDEQIVGRCVRAAGTRVRTAPGTRRGGAPRFMGEADATAPRTAP